MSLVENKKIYFDYEVLEKLEAGIELLGTEVKSLRSGKGSLIGAYVIIRGGEAYASGIDIAAYQVKNAPAGYDPKRLRKLLLSKAEITRLAAIESKKGLTIVPISIYNKGTKLKVEVAVVRGKKTHDKRDSDKSRDVEREVRREFSDR
ncbi:MAG: SsrA-binding protein SmpB [Candidatus Pacebacteria bacterium]|nr:SsrA-binding protein SmpB [Candidatus Paceibacterota bacterium]